VNNLQVFKHELIPILRSFSETELQKFADFLSSPYFSFRKNLKLLYYTLFQFHPLYTHIELTKEYLYQKLFPGKKYKYSSIRDLMSKLHKAARMFLAYNRFSEDNYFSILMLKELRERNLTVQIKKELKKAINKVEYSDGIDPEYFMLKFRLETEKINFNVSTDKHITRKKIIKHSKQIKENSILLIINYISEIVTNYIYLIIESDRFISAKTDKTIQNIAKGIIDDNMFGQITAKSKFDFVIKIYRLLLKAFLNRGSWDEYTEYSTTFNKYLRRFGRDEASFHYSRMISCCILGSKYGNSRVKFDEELLKLYNEFLNGSYYINKKTRYIPANLYRAIILHGIKMNSLGWLYKVISEADSKLHPDDRENMQNYARAYYSFATGNYDEAFKYINLLDINYYIFKYDLYILKLRIYYDRGNYDSLLDQIRNFKQFIRNDKMLPKHTKCFHNNFVYYFERIVKLSLNSPRIDADSLKLKLKKVNDIYHKEWIMNKLDILSKPVQSYRKTS